ncbi:MAG: Extracellular solute-binding protein [Candidatus Peregrinibacteria bacterium GW2011_GWA2_43_8]|nr:MAG: Extracellular solute-binding protein [Candidatus Peregrinibacteria bacterium GW2011_GWA2_43_8]
MKKLFKLLSGIKEVFILMGKTIGSYSTKEKISSLIVVILIAIIVLPPILRDERLTSVTNETDTGNEMLYAEGLVGEITHLNPVFTEFNEVDQDISSLIFSGLSKYDPDEGKVVEDIATHTLSEDYKTYTFTLKNNIYWHDGVEVTAEDVYFTYHDVIQSTDFQNPILRANFESVQVEMVDSRTVTFTLERTNSFFFTYTTVGLLPKHILGDVPISELDTHEFNKNPIGTGPYKVSGPYEEVADNEQVVELELFPDYYGKKSSITSIRFHTFPDMETLLANEGQWHGIARIPEYMLMEAQTDRLSAEQTGYKTTIDTPLLELNQDDWIHQSSQEQAMGALYDEGWELNADGIRENEDGETLTLRLIRRTFDNEKQEKIAATTAEVIKTQLETIGIEVIVEAYDSQAIQSKIETRDYDLLLYGQNLGYNLDTYSYWHSSQATEYGLNLSNYRNPNADALIERIRSTFDQDTKDELLNELAEIIEEDIPAIFLYTPSYYFLVDEKVQGIELEDLRFPSDRFAQISDWYLN